MLLPLQAGRTQIKISLDGCDSETNPTLALAPAPAPALALALALTLALPLALLYPYQVTTRRRMNGSTATRSACDLTRHNYSALSLNDKPDRASPAVPTRVVSYTRSQPHTRPARDTSLSATLSSPDIKRASLRRCALPSRFTKDPPTPSDTRVLPVLAHISTHPTHTPLLARAEVMQLDLRRAPTRTHYHAHPSPSEDRASLLTSAKRGFIR